MNTKHNSAWKQLSLDFNEGLNNALLQQHHAAQFIALAGKHLIPQQSDDSNTNMQYQIAGEWIIGNELGGGQRISLYLPEFKLLILDKENNILRELTLISRTRLDIFEELKQNLSDLNLDVSTFTDKLHYELPAHELDNNAIFSSDDLKTIQENIFYRNNAEIVLNKLAAKFNNAEPVRIWPHHFDTGSLVPMKMNKAGGGVSISIGMGWAIPDTMVDEPYYYLSYWTENPVEDFFKLPYLEAGEWIKTGWTGGIVRNSDIVKISTAEAQQEYVELFFDSGIEILREHFNF
jgi:hypothetical protein